MVSRKTTHSPGGNARDYFRQQSWGAPPTKTTAWGRSRRYLSADASLGFFSTLLYAVEKLSFETRPRERYLANFTLDHLPSYSYDAIFTNIVCSNCCEIYEALTRINSFNTQLRVNYSTQIQTPTKNCTPMPHTRATAVCTPYGYIHQVLHIFMYTHGDGMCTLRQFTECTSPRQDCRTWYCV